MFLNPQSYLLFRELSECSGGTTKFKEGVLSNLGHMGYRPRQAMVQVGAVLGKGLHHKSDPSVRRPAYTRRRPLLLRQPA